MSKIKVVDGRARLPPGRPPTPTKLPNFYRGRRALAERGPRKLMIALADPGRVDRAGRHNPRMMTPTARELIATRRQIHAEQESQIFRIRR